MPPRPRRTRRRRAPVYPAANDHVKLEEMMCRPCGQHPEQRAYAANGDAIPRDGDGSCPKMGDLPTTETEENHLPWSSQSANVNLPGEKEVLFPNKSSSVEISVPNNPCSKTEEQELAVELETNSEPGRQPIDREASVEVQTVMDLGSLHHTLATNQHANSSSASHSGNEDMSNLDSGTEKLWEDAVVPPTKPSTVPPRRKTSRTIPNIEAHEESSPEEGDLPNLDSASPYRSLKASNSPANGFGMILRGKKLRSMQKASGSSGDSLSVNEVGEKKNGANPVDDLERMPAMPMVGVSDMPPKPMVDLSGKPTKLNQNDVVLSFLNSAYKRFMHEAFRNLELTQVDVEMAEKVFGRLKGGGGRFFKVQNKPSCYLQVDEDEALLEIKSHFSRRNGLSLVWRKGGADDASAETVAKDTLLRNTRKRNRPSNFIEVQGQDMLAQEDLRKQAAKRKKVSNGDLNKPFSPNQNREFEQGCVKSKECEEYAQILSQRHHGLEERPTDEHKALWSEEQREQELVMPSKTIKGKLCKDSQESGKKGVVDVITAYSQRVASGKKGKPNYDCGKKGVVAGNAVLEVSLAEASAAGCRKCQKELRIGKKSRGRHDGICPRKNRSNGRKDHQCRDEIKSKNDMEETCLLAIKDSPPPMGQRKDSKKNNFKSARKKVFKWRSKDSLSNVAQSAATATPVKSEKNDVSEKSQSVSAARQSKWKSDKSKMKSDFAESTDTTKPKAVVSAASEQASADQTESAGLETHRGKRTEKDNAHRPKRKSALKARDMLQSHLNNIEDEALDDDQSDGTNSLENGCEDSILRREKDKLYKALSAVPFNEGRYFHEESAWRFHNPAFSDQSKDQLTPLRIGEKIPHMASPSTSDSLKPLPPAPPLPVRPSTGCCSWSFDEKSRVVLANFRDSDFAKENGRVKVHNEDENFLFRMMERDDITLISEGLADSIDASLWTREYIEGCIGSDYHYKFRSFERVTSKDDVYGGNRQTQTVKEKEGWYSMKVSDYFQYLEQRQSVKNMEVSGERSDAINKFTFKDSKGKEKDVDVCSESLYMIDLDIPKLLPSLFEDLQRNFKLPGILPGGTHCMMNAVNANGRPFMGPNLYVTPPASFTHFHQDGHGTVDSGHLCLSGYNEVVMLRRLTERHKCHALQLLTGTSGPHDTLYGLPHRDGMETTSLGWPSKLSVDRCEKMRYYPSVFILKAGQVVHINKGRLHAFRKLAPSQLQESDCHHELREQILQNKETPTEDVCFSVAWDWMFKGYTSDGINREVSSTLECAKLNREHYLQSLAIPETSLLWLARQNVARYHLQSRKSHTNPLFKIDIRQGSSDCDRSEPDAKTVLRGILPSLEYVVNRHKSAVKFSEVWEQKTKMSVDSWRVSIDPKPNAWEDPSTFSLDPYGAGDFFCKFCSEELSNVYMHCDGCELLLDKDFNICSTCHMQEKYRIFHQMHPFNDKSQSILNHTGNKTLLRQARCPCKNGKECRYCSYCTGCSCRCHQWFTLHYRFMDLENELELLDQVESIVGSSTILQGSETKARLFSLISEELPKKGDFTPKKELPESNSICQVIETTKPPRTRSEMDKKLQKVTQSLEATKPTMAKEVTSISEKENSSNLVTKKPKNLNKINDPDQDRKSKKPNVTFHCSKCNTDFFFCPDVAHEAFKEHVKLCGQLSSKEESILPFPKTIERDTLSKDFPTLNRVHTKNGAMLRLRPVIHEELKAGARVMVICSGKTWKATIRRHHSKKGEQGFMIHYDGKKKTTEDWVPTGSVIGFIPKEDVKK